MDNNLDYRGELGVLLLNMSPTSVTFQRGDRIAQLVFNKIEQVIFEELVELTETERGSGGFGSTGTVTEAEVIETDTQFLNQYHWIEPESSTEIEDTMEQ